MGDIQKLDPPENGTSALPPAPATLITSSISKRQRRPSVRLGEIGAHPTASASASHDLSSRRPKLSKLLLHISKPSAKTRVIAPAPARRARTDLKLSAEEYVEDSESPSDRNHRLDSARVRVSNGGDGGIRTWLEGLGLGRYAPVFEIHEVDDAVLPMLTLEDLRDMGINAVGSRRKMYFAIQKLNRSRDS